MPAKKGKGKGPKVPKPPINKPTVDQSIEQFEEEFKQKKLQQAKKIFERFEQEEGGEAPERITTTTEIAPTEPSTTITDASDSIVGQMLRDVAGEIQEDTLASIMLSDRPQALAISEYAESLADDILREETNRGAIGNMLRNAIAGEGAGVETEEAAEQMLEFFRRMQGRTIRSPTTMEIYKNLFMGFLGYFKGHRVAEIALREGRGGDFGILAATYLRYEAEAMRMLLGGMSVYGAYMRGDSVADLLGQGALTGVVSGVFKRGPGFTVPPAYIVPIVNYIWKYLKKHGLEAINALAEALNISPQALMQGVKQGVEEMHGPEEAAKLEFTEPPKIEFFGPEEVPVRDVNVPRDVNLGDVQKDLLKISLDKVSEAKKDVRVPNNRPPALTVATEGTNATDDTKIIPPAVTPYDRRNPQPLNPIPAGVPNATAPKKKQKREVLFVDVKEQARQNPYLGLNAESTTAPGPSTTPPERDTAKEMAELRRLILEASETIRGLREKVELTSEEAEKIKRELREALNSLKYVRADAERLKQMIEENAKLVDDARRGKDDPEEPRHAHRLKARMALFENLELLLLNPTRENIKKATRSVMVSQHYAVEELIKKHKESISSLAQPQPYSYPIITNSQYF